MIFAQADFVKSLAKASAAASMSPSSRKVVLTKAMGICFNLLWEVRAVQVVR